MRERVVGPVLPLVFTLLLTSRAVPGVTQGAISDSVLELGVAAFSFESDRGDWVGRGKSYSFSPPIVEFRRSETGAFEPGRFAR